MQSIGKTEMLETLPELVDPRHTALLVYDPIKQIAFGGSELDPVARTP
jgi:hypothetical protein